MKSVLEKRFNFDDADYMVDPGAGPKPHRSLVSGPTAPCGPQRLAEVRSPLTLSQGLCLVVSPLLDREQGPW